MAAVIDVDATAGQDSISVDAFDNDAVIDVDVMREQDLPEVAGIEKSIFSQPWSEKGFLDSMRMPGALYLTARVRGQIAGYCGMLQCLDEAEITNVAVKEEFRRQQVAVSMLRKLLRRGGQNGVCTFILEVRQSNHAAMNLYQKLGFVSCGIRKNFYEKPIEDAVIMWKR